MTDRQIPTPLIAVVADVLAKHHSRTDLTTIFEESGAPGEPPFATNKTEMCRAWLKRCGETREIDAIAILGRVLERFMEVDQPRSAWSGLTSSDLEGRARVRETLAKHGMAYLSGGVITGAGSGPATKSLCEILRSRDLPGIEVEFARAISFVESDPPAGITAASSLLEALFKAYIEERKLTLPSKQTIGDLYKIVRDDLELDPGAAVENDIRRVLSGLVSLVDGIGGLRTHGGSAHGRTSKTYRLDPRHARLAINGAHTLATFLLETWAHRYPHAE